MPWLEHIGLRERTEPLELRRALMRFLADFSHRPNAATIARTAFSPLEREGARAFLDRCEGCHAARLSADDPSSRVPFEEWERRIFSESAPLVWGSAGYRKTAVLPYVHPEGARTPSLRRLEKKVPYFTNGSARSVDDVLAAIRFLKGETFHAMGPAEGERLDEGARRSLAAFLTLL